MDPIYQSEVAPRVMVIIDGQQRICTAVMLNIALHDYIRRTVSKFEGKDKPHLFWIHEECTQLLADLRNTYMIDRASGDKKLPVLPKGNPCLFGCMVSKTGGGKIRKPSSKN